MGGGPRLACGASGDGGAWSGRAAGPWRGGERATNRETATVPDRAQTEPVAPDEVQTPAPPDAPEQEPEVVKTTVPHVQEAVPRHTEFTVAPMIGRIRGPDGPNHDEAGSIAGRQDEDE